MTAVVVFNPTNVPVIESGIIVGTGEWVFVDDISKVSNQIAKGNLKVIDAPSDPVLIGQGAQGAFEKLRAHENSKQEIERTKRKSRNNKSQSTTDTTEGE